jgi:RNA polymerase sigma factor (sigma-70 family)
VTPHRYIEGVDDSEALVRRIGMGERAAEAELVAHYCSCVFAMALARTHDREAARELVDDVLMAVILTLRRHGVREPARLSGFVRGTAANIINGHVRASRRLPRTVPLETDVADDSPTDPLERVDRDELADRALGLLNARDRQILQLSLLEGLKPAEIAARLGLSSIVVRQRKCRALRAIFMLLQNDRGDLAVRRMLQP